MMRNADVEAGLPGPTVLATETQRRFAAVYRHLDHRVVHNLTFTFRLKGRLDVDALLRAWSLLRERHGALLSTFVETRQGLSLARVAPGPKDVRVEAMPPDFDRDALYARMVADNETRFPWAEGPLNRLSLMTLSPDEHVLMLTAQHIIFDGWSIAVVLRDLGQAYSQIVKGGEAAFAKPALQFSDYALQEQRFLASEVAEAQLRDWDAILPDAAGLPVLDFDAARPPLPMNATIPKADADRFQGGSDVSLPDALLLAFVDAVGRVLGPDHARVVGYVTANRKFRASHTLVGMVADWIPVPRTAGSWPERAAALKAILERPMLPYSWILRRRYPDLYPYVRGIGQAQFNILPLHVPALQMHEIEVQADMGMRPPGTMTHFPLGLFAQPSVAGDWHLGLFRHPDLPEAASAAIRDDMLAALGCAKSA